MIESFMLSAGGRKEILRTFLKIEGYEQTWITWEMHEASWSGVSLMQDEDARLEGQLSPFPIYKENYKSFSTRSREDEKAVSGYLWPWLGREKPSPRWTPEKSHWISLMERFPWQATR
jgi:hypothetical protein